MTEKFACTACGAEHDRDDITAVAECRSCRRMHCKGCLSPEGICKECEEKKGD